MLRQPLAASIAAIVMTLAQGSLAVAAGPPFELSVKKDQLFGSSKGTLVFTQDGVQYNTADRDDARRWAYEDIKQVQILSPARVAVLTYEDGGRLKLGADRTVRFDVVRGIVSSDLVTFLLERITRPVVTAVMPRYGGDPLFRVRVKHQRQGRGSDGTLVLYDSQLLYLTEQEGESRYWRFADLYGVLQLDRYRLQVLAYEGGGGELRPFVFELKTDLPDGLYDALWARVNPPSLDARTTGRPQLVTRSDRDH